MIDKLKNIIVAILIIFAIVVIVVPIGKKVEHRKNRVVYWYVADKKDDIPFAAKLFNEIQDSIYIDCVPIPWNEHEKKLLTAVLSEDPPDVVMLVSTVPKWAARRALVCLENALDDPEFDSTQFYNALWQEMHYRNKLFAVPAYTASYALFYNKSMFERNGLNPTKPPETWQQVKSYSQQILKRDQNNKIKEIGFIPNYGTLETSFLMALELGSTFKQGNKVTLANKEMIKGLNEEISFYDIASLDDINTLIGGFGYGSQHGFISEKVAMMILDNTYIDQIKLYNPDLNYGVAEIPSFESRETKSSTGSWWYAIPRGADNKKGAWEFIKFATNRKIQLREVLESKQALFPANRLAAKDSLFMNKHFSMKVFDKQMENTESKVLFPLIHDVFWREFSFARERALHKIESPAEALKQAEKTIQFNLDRAVEYDRYVEKKLPIEQF